MTMKTSDAGLFALAMHEGIVPGPYRDSVGVFTYGIGHTVGAGYPDPVKMQRGMPSNLDAALRDVFDLFRRDIAKYEAGVNRAVKVPVSQAQFDALVSFHYNTGAIAKASFVKKLNAGDTIGAAAGMMAWSKPAEIIPRRKAEQRLFAHGVYPTGQVTVWKVDGNGKVIWKPVRQLTKDQVLALLDGPVAEPHKPAEAPKTPAQAQKPAKPSAIKETGKAAGGGLLGGGVALAVVAFWDQIAAFFGGIAAKWEAFWVSVFSIFN
mgnify:CR=1 FL=1